MPKDKFNPRKKYAVYSKWSGHLVIDVTLNKIFTLEETNTTHVQWHGAWRRYIKIIQFESCGPLLTVGFLYLFYDL